MRGENFIFFLGASGFFIGLIFSLIHDYEIFEFLYVTFFITSVFYILGLASVTMFIKYLDVKRMAYFNKNEIDEILDLQIKELEKKEDFILESYEFIKQIEREELNIKKKQ